MRQIHKGMLSWFASKVLKIGLYTWFKYVSLYKYSKVLFVIFLFLFFLLAKLDVFVKWVFVSVINDSLWVSFEKYTYVNYEYYTSNLFFLL